MWTRTRPRAFLLRQHSDYGKSGNTGLLSLLPTWILPFVLQHSPCLCHDSFEQRNSQRSLKIRRSSLLQVVLLKKKLAGQKAGRQVICWKFAATTLERSSAMHPGSSLLRKHRKEYYRRSSNTVFCFGVWVPVLCLSSFGCCLPLSPALVPAGSDNRCR